MNDGRRAELLISQAVQPDFQEELRTLGVNRFFREIFSALVRVANSVVLTWEALNEGEAVTRQIQQDAEDAQARAKAAEEALESMRVECAGKIRKAESRAETEATRRRAALTQLAEAESAVEARNLHIEDLNSIIEAAETRAKQAGEETIAKEAERAAAEAQVVELKAAIEARAVAAVEEFKASEHFTRELVEANADFYVQGFNEAKEKVARVWNLPQVMDLEPDQGPDEALDDESAAKP